MRRSPKDERADVEQGDEGMTPVEAERIQNIRENPFGALLVNGDAIPSNKKHSVTLNFDDEYFKLVDELRKGMWVQVQAKDGGNRVRPMSRKDAIQRCAYAGLQEGLKKKQHPE